MFKTVAALRRAGLLGMNERNASFIMPYNARKLYPLVDDKLLTKSLAQAAGIAVPELYHVVRTQRQIRDLPQALSAHQDFALKPAEGSGGEGILIVVGRSKNRYRLIDGTLLDQSELNYHVSSILSGVYSLGGQTDKAMFEYRVKPDPVFSEISHQGVPDIRTILFQGVPVMAMVRLPTRKSHGKANLHQGAIGAGIDLQTGLTRSAVCGTEIVDEHPDTGNPVEGVQVPNWDSVLTLATSSYELTHLGYMGVDIVLDKNQGALILELNARPGLNIQLANLIGLRRRLALVTEHAEKLTTIAERVAFAKEKLVPLK